MIFFSSSTTFTDVGSFQLELLDFGASIGFITGSGLLGTTGYAAADLTMVAFLPMALTSLSTRGASS